MTAKLINVMSGSETMSMMSGVLGADALSMDSGPESHFNFEDLDKNKEESKIGGGEGFRRKIKIKPAQNIDKQQIQIGGIQRA